MLAASFDAWRFVFDPEWVVALVLFAAGYWWAASVLGAAPWRRACFLAGLALVAAALLSPIEHVALHSMLSFHLLQNVMLADWAPPLLVLGLSPAMAAAVERRSAFVPSPGPPSRSATGSPSGTSCTSRPSTAMGSITAGCSASSTSPSSRPASLFWWPVLVEGRMAPMPKLVYLAAAFFIAAPVALVIALAGSTIYPFYDSTPHLFGQSPLEDQQVGGMLMAVEQSVLLFAAFSWTFFRLLSEDEQAPDAVGSV